MSTQRSFFGQTLEPWGSPDFPRNLTAIVLKAWIWVDIGAIITVFVGQGMIINNSVTRYNAIYGVGNAPRHYDNDGYVPQTNVPEHYGSIYWSSAAQASLFIWLLLCLASESVVLYSTKKNGWTDLLVMFYTPGLMVGKFQWEDKGAAAATPEGRADMARHLVPYYCIANAFLKFYIVILYEAQSFSGIGYGSDQPGGNGIDNNRFCLVAGWVLLASIIPGIVAQFFSFLVWRGLGDEKFSQEWEKYYTT